jgi:hypothetical protein
MPRSRLGPRRHNVLDLVRQRHLTRVVSEPTDHHPNRGEVPSTDGRIYGHSYNIEAELQVPDDGVERLIAAEVDAMGGLSLGVG